MNDVDNEKKILEETPDFENQLKILEEEEKEVKKRKRWYRLISSLALFVVVIFIVSYSTIYVYREYHGGSNNCSYVNLKINGSVVPNLNVTHGKNCVPKWFIDYYKDGIPTFSIDVYGDKSFIFNEMNQKDKSGKYCVLNCDSDNDGWPDYNIDLNGDGTPDVNIILQPEKYHRGMTCDLNCDINKDRLPDLNVDINCDNSADINIDKNKDGVPDYNIDYMGNRKAIFSILNSDGTIKNQVNDAHRNKSCTTNCDTDNDGWPDYNIVLDETNGVILNQKIKDNKSYVKYSVSKFIDWKCSYDNRIGNCDEKVDVRSNTYINIDVNGDGIPDVNKSSDNGKTIINEINKSAQVDDKKIILNIDADNDGFPDYNIDLNDDNIPDMNIVNNDNKKYQCIKNCDTNKNGRIDSPEGNKGNKNINIEIDYDGICDLNCDMNYDGVPDYNIDVDGDSIPDKNIDRNNTCSIYCSSTKNDGICTFEITECTLNCDTNGDGIPDVNVDIDGDGIPDINIDTDGDGIPDKNVDTNGDSKCDINCEQPGEIDIEDQKIIISNPLSLYASNITPGFEGKYILTIKNESDYAVSYKLLWKDVNNEFTNTNELVYSIKKNNIDYKLNLEMPKSDGTAVDNLILKAKSTVRYVLKVNWIETGVNQNIDSGKSFKGSFTAEIVNTNK